MCSEMVVLDAIGKSASLPEGETVAIEFTPQQAGDIRADVPKEHLALMLLGALRLLVKRWRLSKYAFDLRTESQRVWQSLCLLFAKNV